MNVRESYQMKENMDWDWNNFINDPLGEISDHWSDYVNDPSKGYPPAEAAHAIIDGTALAAAKFKNLKCQHAREFLPAKWAVGGVSTVAGCYGLGQAVALGCTAIASPTSVAFGPEGAPVAIVAEFAGCEALGTSIATKCTGYLTATGALGAGYELYTADRTIGDIQNASCTSPGQIPRGNSYLACTAAAESNIGNGNNAAWRGDWEQVHEDGIPCSANEIAATDGTGGALTNNGRTKCMFRNKVTGDMVDYDGLPIEVDAFYVPTCKNRGGAWDGCPKYDDPFTYPDMVDPNDPRCVPHDSYSR